MSVLSGGGVAATGAGTGSISAASRFFASFVGSSSNTGGGEGSALEFHNSL